MVREEIDAAYDRLADERVPFKLAGQLAGRDFAGWRGKNDAVLPTQVDAGAKKRHRFITLGQK